MATQRTELNSPTKNAASEKMWVQSLAEAIRKTDRTAESRMRTMLVCDIKSNKPALYVPPDMADLQPRSLRYLHAFARSNDLKLVEDRRQVEVQPITEKRNRKPPKIALGLSMLLNQTGAIGAIRTLSEPHRLNADSTHIGITKLIDMAAFAAPKSKRVVVLPNRMIVDVSDNDTQPMVGYACKLISTDTTTILSHFDSPKFRAIGYSAGSQYVMHVCLAGGPLENQTLWAHLHTLTQTDFRFQLFPSRKPANDFGLFYTTYYLDMAQSPVPWWIASEPDTESEHAEFFETATEKRTG
jgi:hypothetical protein